MTTPAKDLKATAAMEPTHPTTGAVPVDAHGPARRPFAECAETP